MTALIEIEHLVKRFGPLTAVDDISCRVARGEVLGFLGPNGAGKSTTMKMITGYLSPTSGRVTVSGHDVATAPLAAKREIGYLPEGAPAYPDMTPLGFLEFIAEIRGFSGQAGRARIADVVERIDLGQVLHQPIDTLSKGYKRRVGLAQALLHDPQVLIMDEPTDGLDPNQKHQVRELIKHMAEDKAIVISTHILEEVEAVCTRALVIAQGRIVVDGTPEQLLAMSEYHNAVVLAVATDEVNRVAASLRSIDGVARVDAVGDSRFILFAAERQVIAPRVNSHVQDQGWQVTEFHVQAGRMDDVFRKVTSKGEA